MEIMNDITEGSNLINCEIEDSNYWYVYSTIFH